MKDEIYISTICSTPTKKVHKLYDGSVMLACKVCLNIPQQEYDLYTQLLQLRTQSQLKREEFISRNNSRRIEKRLESMTPTLSYITEYFYKTALESKDLQMCLQSMVDRMIRASNVVFYSTDNIFWSKKQEAVQLNISSMAGMTFALQNSNIGREELREIFELMDSSFFQREGKDRFNHKLKFRAIAKFIAESIIGRNFTLFFEEGTLPEIVNYNDAIECILKCNERAIKLLSIKQIKQKVQKCEQNDRANYYYFFKRVYVDDCKDLCWSEVINLIFSSNDLMVSQDIFSLATDLIYERDFNINIYEEFGLSSQRERWIYLLVKLGVNIQPFLEYSTIEDYFRDRQNFCFEKQQICKAFRVIIIDYTKMSEQNAEMRNEKWREYYQQLLKIIQKSCGEVPVEKGMNDGDIRINEQQILSKFNKL